MLFILASSFIKTQRIGPTLIYHPVDSPYLLPFDPTSSYYGRKNELQFERINGPLGVEATDAASADRNATRIPNIVHFVFGMDQNFGGVPFGFQHYLSIYSGKALLPCSSTPRR